MAATWWLFGNSIPWGVGTPNPIADSWPSVLRSRAATAGIAVELVNFAIGGRLLVGPPGPSISESAINALSANPAPDGVIVAGAENDMVSYDETTLEASKYALIAIDMAYAAAGVANRLYTTTLPCMVGGGCPAEWLPAMLSRRTSWNTWMRAMWGPAAGRDQLIDLAGELREDSTGTADASLMFDGLHPNKAGAARVAAAFPLARLTGATGNGG